MSQPKMWLPTSERRRKVHNEIEFLGEDEFILWERVTFLDTTRAFL